MLLKAIPEVARMLQLHMFSIVFLESSDFQTNFWAVGQAVLAADWKLAWKSLPEAALAADLITASKSLQGSTIPTPLQPLSGPCSIEKYPSSRIANRYTRIFDAG